MSSGHPGVEAGTRGRLLDAAERLFANLGAVNYHFRSKETLYAEVFARRAAALREPVLAAATEAESVARRSPGQAFQILGRAFLAPHENRDAAQCLLSLATREAVERRLPVNVFGKTFFEPALDAVARVVRQIRPDLPPATAKECAHAFVAQLMHILKVSHAGARTSSNARLEHAVRFTVAAVRHLEAEPAGPAHRLARRQ